MGRRRGFFAELQHQARVAEREALRAERETEREYNAAVRKAEQMRKAEERATKQAARAHEAERKRFEKEAKEAHVAAMLAEVEHLNAELIARNEEVDSILAATLPVDDYVDLATLRLVPEHPAFLRPDLETPIPTPAEIRDPPQPVLRAAEPPKGLSRLLGRTKYRREVERRQREHDAAMSAWKKQLAQLPELRQNAADQHRAAEEARLRALQDARDDYQAECAVRDEEARVHNEKVDSLIANLAYGVPEAIQEYVSIVLSNSVYPDHFPVDHDFEFDPQTAELRLRVTVPRPEAISTVKSYKYVKSSDEIGETSLSQKALKDRYGAAVHGVALRSFHEVFEADRRGLVQIISLEVGTTTVDPATGKSNYFPFVAAATDRESFLEIELAKVVPLATLQHLGAVVAKNPYGLEVADTSGVKRHD